MLWFLLCYYKSLLFLPLKSRFIIAYVCSRFVVGEQWTTTISAESFCLDHIQCHCWTTFNLSASFHFGSRWFGKVTQRFPVPESKESHMIWAMNHPGLNCMNQLWSMCLPCYIRVSKMIYFSITLINHENLEVYIFLKSCLALSCTWRGTVAWAQVTIWLSWFLIQAFAQLRESVARWSECRYQSKNEKQGNKQIKREQRKGSRDLVKMLRGLLALGLSE